MPEADPISTSPLAGVALNVIQHLDKLIGPVEAQMFMLKGNDVLGGDTPVTAIKQGRREELANAVRCVAAEKGIFEAPWLPPGIKK